MIEKYLDVSNNNAEFDAVKVKEAGYTGVIFKASEGATVTDTTFEARYKAAKKAGLERGAYCFARPATSTALEEAKHFCEIVGAAGGFDEWKELGGRIPAFIDFEDATGLNETTAREYVLTWLEEVARLTGYKGGLYCNTNFLDTYHLNVVQEEGYTLWVAQYSANDPNVREALWQHTDAAKVPGLTGDFDESLLTVDSPVTSAIWHRVVGGDSLFHIAVHYKTTVKELLKLNPGIVNPDRIFVGQQIKVN